MYGPHLLLEGYNCNAELLADMGFVYRVLDMYPERIKMRKIMPPHVQKYLDPGDPSWGLSGFVLIAESHIAIHTYPEKGFATLDVFSCKDFDENAATEFFLEMFEVERFHYRLYKRGKDYPKDIKKSLKVVSSERAKISAAAHAR
ncbi:MAG: adenosylmethionine decarboxylase [bacterium]